MTRPCSLLLAAALLAALASSGRADEGTGSAAEEAIKLPGARGLVGFGDMVDARSPGLLSIRVHHRRHHRVTVPLEPRFQTQPHGAPHKTYIPHISERINGELPAGRGGGSVVVAGLLGVNEALGLDLPVA